MSTFQIFFLFVSLALFQLLFMVSGLQQLNNKPQLNPSSLSLSYPHTTLINEKKKYFNRFHTNSKLFKELHVKTNKMKKMFYDFL